MCRWLPVRARFEHLNLFGVSFLDNRGPGSSVWVVGGMRPRTGPLEPSDGEWSSPFHSAPWMTQFRSSSDRSQLLRLFSCSSRLASGQQARVFGDDFAI